MKITNETEWDTAAIRRIVARVAKDELDPEARRHLRVRVIYRRHRSWMSLGQDIGVAGNAMYGTPRRPGPVTIRVSRHGIDTVDLAYVAAHEIAHGRGVDHKAMRGSVRYDRVDGHRERYGWAEAMPVGLTAPRVKPKPGADERIALAERRLKEWTTRLRRAETGVKKYERRIKDLRRRQAASSSTATAASRNEAVIAGPGNLRTIAAETVGA